MRKQKVDQGSLSPRVCPGANVSQEKWDAVFGASKPEAPKTKDKK